MKLKFKKRKKRKILFLILLLTISLVTIFIFHINDAKAESYRTLERKKVREEVQLVINKVDKAGNQVAVSNEIKNIANKLDSVLEFKLKGQGQLYASYSVERGVDPYLAVAISIHESYRGASSAITKYNNVGGMMGSNGLIHYNSIEEGIKKFIDNLADNYYAKGLNTIEKIGKKYAGSTKWSNNVNYFYNKIIDGTYKTGLPLNTQYASSEWY